MKLESISDYEEDADEEDVVKEMMTR